MVELANVEEMVKRLSDQKGVMGVVIANGQGVPIRSTMENDKSIQYGALVAQISKQARSFVREVSPEDDLDYIRLRSKGKEVIIAPNFDGQHKMSLTVIQNPFFGASDKDTSSATAV